MKIKINPKFIRISGQAGTVLYFGYTFNAAAADYLNRILNS